MWYDAHVISNYSKEGHSTVIKNVQNVKSKLSAVSELNTELINKMTDTQLLSYVQALDVTANTFPMQKEELEYAFNAKDYAPVMQWLGVISSSLVQVHADALVKYCEKHIDLNQDIENIRHEKLKIFIDYFMPTLEVFYNDIHDLLVTMEEEEEAQEVQPAKVREKLLTVSELNAKTIKQMSEEELDEYVGVLNFFHENFHTQENGLRSAVKIKHYVFVMQWLTSIEESLTKIHAGHLLDDCRSQIELNKDFNNIRHDKLEIFVNYFLSSLSMLAADIKQLHLPKQMPKKEAAKAVIEDLKSEVEQISAGSSKNAKTILIVNKMKIFMNSVKSALSESGHELLGATSGLVALGYLKSAKPDLLIIDVDLTDVDCYRLVKTIRDFGHKIPIIFTTSKITKESMVKFMEAGVADFIAKPIVPQDVQKKIAKHLG